MSATNIEIFYFNRVNTSFIFYLFILFNIYRYLLFIPNIYYKTDIVQRKESLSCYLIILMINFRHNNDEFLSLK